MSRTVTALYDSRAQAEAARQRLASEVNLTAARIIDQDSDGSGQGDGSLRRVPMSHEDRQAYGEGLRRGGFLLSAEVAGHEDADKIVHLLEQSSSVDLDQRQQDWRRDGWSPQPATAAGPGNGGSNIGAKSTEQHVPLVTEELVVGKREVNRGGARVRSYVREVPVHDQVTLRDEHVVVERHPVNQRIDPSQLDTGDLLRSREIEMTETHEEAVISKEARVREEVAVRKTVEQRVEQIDDNVRRTEVDVDDTTGKNRSAFSSFGSDNPRNPPVTGVESMAQDKGTTDGLGGSNFTTGTGTTSTTGASSTGTGTTGTTGSAGTTGTTGSTSGSSFGGSQSADTYRPTGDTAGTHGSTQHIETQGYNEARSTYQPSTDLTVTQRRTASRPSRNLVIGSAVAGAIAGGALPFMFGRKSTESRQVEVDATRTGPSAHVDSASDTGRKSGRRRS